MNFKEWKLLCQKRFKRHGMSWSAAIVADFTIQKAKAAHKSGITPEVFVDMIYDEVRKESK